MESNLLFSVIIPTYNRAHLISKAIQSVIDQQYNNWELLIIDDGSNDNTKIVVSTFNDSRITYFHQTNKGRSAARNLGIELAKGDYICFLDSDDYYFINHLQAFYNFILHNNLKDVFLCCKTSEDKNGIIVPFQDDVEPSSNVVEEVLLNRFGAPRVCISSKILKKNPFDTQLWIGEDIELWQRIVRKYPFYRTNDNTVAFCIHKERTVTTNSIEIYREYRKVLSMIFAYDKNEKLISSGVKNKLLAYSYFDTARFYYSNKKIIPTLLNICKSLLKNPTFRLKEQLYMAAGSIPGGNFLLSLFRKASKT